jgi:hypothetical protein
VIPAATPSQARPRRAKYFTDVRYFARRSRGWESGICEPDDDVQTALATMKPHHVRRLPVEGFGGTVAGVISMNDILLAAGKKGGHLRSSPSGPSRHRGLTSGHTLRQHRRCHMTAAVPGAAHVPPREIPRASRRSPHGRRIIGSGHYSVVDGLEGTSVARCSTRR